MASAINKADAHPAIARLHYTINKPLIIDIQHGTKCKNRGIKGSLSGRKASR